MSDYIPFMDSVADDAYDAGWAAGHAAAINDMPQPIGYGVIVNRYSVWIEGPMTSAEAADMVASTPEPMRLAYRNVVALVPVAQP